MLFCHILGLKKIFFYDIVTFANAVINSKRNYLMSVIRSYITMFEGSAYMESIGERIKWIRTNPRNGESKKTQEEFAKELGITRNTVATYEVGKSNPSDGAIALICNVFSISETWLRTGQGEPYIERTRDKRIEDFFKDVELGTDAFKTAFVNGLAKLTTEEWKTLEAICRKLVESNVSPVDASALPDNLEELPTEDLEDIYKNVTLQELSGKEHTASNTSGEEKKDA